MSDEKQSLIGFDPLAWMHDDDEEESPVGGEREASPADADAPAVVEPATEVVEASPVVEDEAPEVAALDETIPVENGTAIEADPIAEIEAVAEPAPVASESPVLRDTADEGKPLTIRLGDSLDISVVGVVYEELNNVLQQGRDVVLDGSELERADTAALQMLCAFARELRGRDINLSWREPSAALRESAALIGAEALLGVAA